ncbi:MAG: DNA-protecting protein DprA [Nitrospirae bacterium]|nr:DNA-protecting protein DprA [Nitrospirota bacterium]
MEKDPLMDPRLYWLALGRIPGLGEITCKQLLAVFPSPQTIFSKPASELARIPGVSTTVAKKITSFSWKTDLPELTRELHRADQQGARLITQADAEYPPSLKEIPDPPLCFYLLGRLLPQDQRALAVVGTRHATPYGKKVASQFSRELASSGFTIVSGLARGIDSTAHQTAIDSGGRTIAVIGNGITIFYPPENQSLMERIAGSGAILSELPPEAPPHGHHFPRRNRLISGLSLGTLVVEAAEQSGSLITARLAADQGKEVFAVPGSIHSPLSRGTHSLIQQGAKLVETVEDILEELPPWLTIEEKRDIKKNSISGNPLSGSEFPGLAGLMDEEKQLWTALTCDLLQHPDEIAAACRRPVQQVMILLLGLEMKGLVRQENGKYMRETHLWPNH